MTEGWGEGVGQGGFVPNMGGRGWGWLGFMVHRFEAC